MYGTKHTRVDRLRVSQLSGRVILIQWLGECDAILGMWSFKQVVNDNGRAFFFLDIANYHFLLVFKPHKGFTKCVRKCSDLEPYAE